MRLWTWQGMGVSLTSGKVNHSQSEFLNSPIQKDRELIQSAYRRLVDMLGTDQIVWCFTWRYEWFQTENNRRIEHELDVPVTDFLAVIDCLSWERIIGNETHYPSKLLEKWKSDARQSLNSSSDIDEIDRYLEKQKAEFDEKLSQQDLWDHLFLDCKELNVLDLECTALIKHPVNPEWIIQK